ncbi:MAG: U32 family peptidase [Oscillospiraceae bacterium]|nr:U32 family peptidase [Oscillospiraceae bacterium]
MKAELLAPAGTLECVKTALYFGADAVYCGGPLLQLRAESSALSFDEIEFAASLCHKMGKKLYITVNCFAENGEIPQLKDYASRLKEIGADALIVSDLGAIAELREKCPEMDIHVSTQANTMNYRTVNFYRDMGVKRVVLGREMTLKQIEELKGLIHSDIEIEAFVHGAMCMAYSGRCLLSSFLTNRSGNRGECSQPCRWNYYLVEEKRGNMHIPVIEDAGATAILSSADLKCIGFLDRLENAGVCSFKIEGRMKSPYYVATVINAYRQFMDGRAGLKVCEEELNCASHRPYSSGFYFGDVKNDPNNDGLYRRTCDFIGIVCGKTEKDEYIIEMRNRFSVGDVLEVLSPNSLGRSFKVESIRGENGESKNAAVLVQEKIAVNCPFELESGDILRKRIV